MDVVIVTGREYDSNIYLILGDEVVIVDTGTGSHYSYVIDSIKQHIDLDKVTCILLTHEHFDHTGGINPLCKMCPNAKVVMHEECRDSLRKKIEWTSTAMGLKMPLVHRVLKDGDILKLGSIMLEVIYTPGHSLGSICLYDNKTETLFSGDTVFSHGGFGRTDLEGGDLASLVSSLKKLMKLPIKNLYPGHGLHITRHADYHLNLAYTSALSCL
jgi:glyoxylase-like metal-dependent hydrolase (beta-lactamase superfamily II)